MSRVGETIGGKFELTELIGRSEFGSTYRAKTPTDTIVSLKLFHDDLDPVVTRALFGNAKVVSGIKHSRVIEFWAQSTAKSLTPISSHNGWTGNHSLSD